MGCHVVHEALRLWIWTDVVSLSFMPFPIISIPFICGCDTLGQGKDRPSSSRTRPAGKFPKMRRMYSSRCSAF